MRQARPKRERKEPRKYQGWQKTSICLNRYVRRVFGFYYLENKGEVKRCLENLLKSMLILDGGVEYDIEINFVIFATRAKYETIKHNIFLFYV